MKGKKTTLKGNDTDAIIHEKEILSTASFIVINFMEGKVIRLELLE